MKYLCAVVCLAIIAVVSAEYGHYVPKAFYKIDENGHQSPSYFIELPEEAIHPRFRRAARAQYNPYFQPGVPQAGFGFPQQQPGFGFAPFPQAGQSGTFSGISSSVTSTGGSGNLASRFGEDEPITHGQTTTFTSNNGHFTQTTHNLGPDGKVQTHVQKGRV